MKVNIETIENFLVINLKGEIDHHNAGFIRTEIENKIENTKINNLIFNFKDVTFMDSSGIGMVIGRYRLVSSRKGQVYVTNLSKEVHRIFDISGLFKIIKNYETVYECLSLNENSAVEV